MTLRVLFVASLLILSPSRSSALCQMIPDVPGRDRLKEAAAELNAAFAVFTGEVMAWDSVSVRIRVDRVWKGNLSEVVVIRTAEIDPITREIRILNRSFEGSPKLGEPGSKHLIYTYGKSVETMQDGGACGPNEPLQSAGPKIALLEKITKSKPPTPR